MVEEIKELRVKIDGLSQLVKNIVGNGLEKNIEAFFNDEGNSKELDKAYDSLILAKAWLGKILGELGTVNPYGEGYKTKEDIEPTADTAKNIKDFPLDSRNWGDNINNISHIEKVDWLRTEIQAMFKQIEETNFYGIYFHEDEMGDNYCNWFYKYLHEARFWLGFELQRIKETQ